MRARVFDLCCGTWDLAPDQGLNPGPRMRSASLCHWTAMGNFRGTLLILCHMTQSRLDKSILKVRPGFCCPQA